MLSKGEFRNLYVYGYDSPEAYAISKSGKMYYAFFAAEAQGKTGGKSGTYKGEIELRGLDAKQYRVLDYVNSRDYGTVQGPSARLSADFKGSLLLEVTPVN